MSDKKYRKPVGWDASRAFCGQGNSLFRGLAILVYVLIGLAGLAAILAPLPGLAAAAEDKGRVGAGERTTREQRDKGTAHAPPVNPLMRNGENARVPDGVNGVGAPPPPGETKTMADVPVWERSNVTPELLAQELVQLEKRLEELPKDAAAESIDARLRTIFKERQALVAEWRGMLERIAALNTELAGRAVIEQLLAKELEAQVRLPPPVEPGQPTPEGFAEAQKALADSQRAMEAVETAIKERNALMAGLPERVAQAKERLKQAIREGDGFTELAGREGGDKQQLLVHQAGNARLKARVAEESLKVWAEEKRFENESLSFRDRQLELARLRNQWRENALARYQAALNRLQESVLRQKEAELLAKSQAARAAVDPAERFQKHWEAESARLQKNVADLDKLKTDLLTRIGHQERLLKKDREELKALQEMVGRGGLSERVAEQLKQTFRQLEGRRINLAGGIVSRDLRDKLDAVRGRRFEIDGYLTGLRERWRLELAAAMRDMDETAAERFTRKVEPLLDTIRDQLAREKQLLLEVDGEERRLDLYPADRQELLLTLETFVLSNIFWIQDAPPIGLETARMFLGELFAIDNPRSLINWWLQVLSRETVVRLLQSLKKPEVLLAFLILVMAIPLWWLLVRKSRRLREAIEPVEDGSMLHPEVVLSAVLTSALVPACLLIAARMIGGVGLPVSVGAVVQRTLLHMAIFLFAWGLNRLFFTRHGILAVRFNVPGPVADQLYRAFRVVLLAYLVCLLPWMIFRVAPFHHHAIPRLGYTLFEIAVAVTILLLIRPGSPLVEHTFGPAVEGSKAGSSFAQRHWRLISRLITLFMLAVIGLDGSGYRFGAAQLAHKGLLTLFTLFVLIGTFHLMIRLLERIIRSRRRIPTVIAPGERAAASRVEFIAQFRRSLRLVFLVVGVLLFAHYWGLNERIFHVLSDHALYSATGPGGVIEIITLADLTRFLIGLALLAWVIRHMPKLFELIVFSQLRMDSGLRYAIVTMSRYLVFLVGLFIIFSFLKLDLAKVGWLVAAISVGLGFGLQEIVANFVSGIILLLERPIRVGDLIAVGTSLGKVTRINIRATTILTPDLQELLIPNRDLITKEVTNWTLGNPNIRLQIPIGVAYGSDIDQVMGLLMELAKSQPEVLADPAPEVLFVAHGPSSLDFEVRVFVGNPSLLWPMRSRLNKLINHAFQEQGISIPFPQQDVYIRSAPPAAPAAPGGSS